MTEPPDTRELRLERRRALYAFLFSPIPEAVPERIEETDHYTVIRHQNQDFVIPSPYCHD